MCSLWVWRPLEVRPLEVSVAMWHDSFICVIWFTYIWRLVWLRATTDWYVSRDRTHKCDVTLVLCDLAWQGWQNVFICVTWRFHAGKKCVRLCDMLHSYWWHDAFIRVIRRIHAGGVMYWHMWHAACTHVTCCIHTCDAMYSYVWHTAFILRAALIHATYCILVCSVMHAYMWHTASMGVTRCMHTCDILHPYV